MKEDLKSDKKLRSEEIVNAVKNEAENLYRSGAFYCSEAIVYSIRKYLVPDIPFEAVSMSSGFPVGMGGAQCSCGATVGGIMCLGYCFGRNEPHGDGVAKAMSLSKELHDSFQRSHKALCCRILTKGMELGSPEHMAKCVSFTGEVAAKTVEIILRERQQIKADN
jgi:C_GCAxxG_C_C family probable redox protein